MREIRLSTRYLGFGLILLTLGLIWTSSSLSNAVDSAQLQPSPSISLTPIPTETPIISVTPAQNDLYITIIHSAGITYPGSYATEEIKTLPGSYCTISVVYHSGPSHAQGLYGKTAGSDGLISWSWFIGTNTYSGNWPIYMVCSSSGDSKQVQDTVVVQ